MLKRKWFKNILRSQNSNVLTYKGHTLEDYKNQLKELELVTTKSYKEALELQEEKKTIEIYIKSMEFLNSSDSNFSSN
jgi:hypothetical protein